MAKILARAALLLCGLAVTWICAACGLFLLTMPGGCRFPKTKTARLQVMELDTALDIFRLEHGRCATTKNELLTAGGIGHSSFADPWGTSIAFWCSGDTIIVRSAGPDREFGTADDVTNE